jgi:hypothetical protein
MLAKFVDGSGTVPTHPTHMKKVENVIKKVYSREELSKLLK